LQSFCLGWPLTAILSISAFKVARITGMSNCTQQFHIITISKIYMPRWQSQELAPLQSNWVSAFFSSENMIRPASQPRNVTSSYDLFQQVSLHFQSMPVGSITCISKKPCLPGKPPHLFFLLKNNIKTS
jgi:hypothetical protein